MKRVGAMDAAARSRHEAARCLLLAEAFADAPTAEVVERCRAAWAEADERQGGRAGINCANSGTDGNAKADHSGDLAGSGCTTGHLENAFSEPDLRDIRVDYTALCCGTNADSPLPYESIYRGGERLLKGPGCVGLAELYKREGFLPPKGASNEPEDFLPTLLGFLALWAVHLTAGLTGITLGLNLWNALVVAVLGVPGFVLLLLVQWVL
mgnify:CR=1 FL=1